MKTYTKEEINGILKNHVLWLKNKSNGIRADFSGAYLCGADLSGANLSRANLSGADLSRANLSEANLSEANLSRANLSGAYFCGADLSGANLSRANLSGAYLSEADLSRANLSRAYFCGADLSGANLSRANLSGADLSRANLTISEWTKLKDKFSIVTPDTKYVYKKLRNNVIAHLELPKNAKRSNAFGRKCRAEKAKVLKLIDSNGKNIKIGFSQYDNNFKYEVGKIVAPLASFDENWFNECGSGIHFFLTESEAKEFTL